MSEQHKNLFMSALKTTIPVFLGYIPLGMAFGFLLDGAGYHWVYALIMAIFIYAGSGQFLAVALLAAGAGITEFVIATLLLNLRHSFYGLSLLDRFSDVGKVKPYLIFALTDETYALLTSTEVPDGGSKSKFYLYIAALDHLYWITGCVLGAVLGSLLDLNLEGMAFVLTALFVVLTIEQYFNATSRFPFMAALGAGVVSLVIFSPENMLLLSIILGTFILIAHEKFMGAKSGNVLQATATAAEAQPVSQPVPHPVPQPAAQVAENKAKEESS
ncbi:AzlC family ABC transporter permease [Methanosarcina sp. Mfa9]|uniref:AzlC family ABC transporter permease n=1 Tax=Methanosarcina sp. Mfa9 TaxID=3439063 RepID=UPI003F827DC9